MTTDNTKKDILSNQSRRNNITAFFLTQQAGMSQITQLPQTTQLQIKEYENHCDILPYKSISFPKGDMGIGTLTLLARIFCHYYQNLTK